MNVLKSDKMAALSLSPSSSVSRHTVSPPSAKGVVTFGADDVRGSNALSTSFYDGDEYYSANTEHDRRDSSGSHHHQHVGFSLDLSGTAASDDGSEDIDVNCNSSGSGEGSGSKKFLTAKYKKHRMGMVRRRIEVEDWIDVELRRLCELPEGSYDTYDAELDIDELIDFATDNERVSYVKSQLSSTPISAAKIDAFIQELVKKIAAL